MTYAIEIQDDAGLAAGDTARLRRAADATLAAFSDLPSTALTIWLTDDATLAALNDQFRGEPKPTDVLSFAADDAFPVADTLPYLGDIAISVPYAERTARRGGHATIDELQLLVIHGVLHLLGYEHDDADAEAAMWAAQTHLLARLGATITGPLPDGDVRGVSIALLTCADGRFLLQLRDDKPAIHHPNQWAFFGGAQERDETPLDAVRREVAEEIGLHLDPDRFHFLGAFYHEPGVRLDAFFAAIGPTELAQAVLGEGQAYRCVTAVQIAAGEVDGQPFVAPHRPIFDWYRARRAA